MSWFTSILGVKEVVEPVKAIGNIIDQLFTSDDERAAGELLKQKLNQAPMLAQTEINKVQASHRSTFVAGARPFLMWVCGFGLLFAFLLNPLMEWLMPERGSPELPLDAMMELTLAMLGLATLRTVEKVKGVSK